MAFDLAIARLFIVLRLLAITGWLVPGLLAQDNRNAGLVGHWPMDVGSKVHLDALSGMSVEALLPDDRLWVQTERGAAVQVDGRIRAFSQGWGVGGAGGPARPFQARG
jgi:hypothetical protein